MLQTLRDKLQGWIAAAIIFVIVASFVLWGIGDYVSASGFGSKVAKVGDQVITAIELEDQVELLRRQVKGELPPDLDLEQFALDRLIQVEQFRQGIQRLGLIVGEQQVWEQILAIPDFHQDGKFSPERFQQVLQNARLDEATLLKEVHLGLLQNQLHTGLTRTDFVTKPEFERIRDISFQVRSFEYLRVPFARALDIATAKITDTDIENYFNAHASEFMTPERVKAEVLRVAVDQFIPQEALSDTELKQYYQDNLNDFTIPERVHVAHILVSVMPNASAEAVAAAEQKITEIRKEILGGKEFALLAKQHSDDTVSAKKGGDLGWISPKDTVESFEKAAFALTAAAPFSEVIRTQYGFHVLQWLGHEPQKVSPFEEAQSLVEERVRLQKAQNAYMEIRDKAVEKAFESPEDLIGVAEALGLKVTTTDFFDRSGEGLTDTLRFPKLLELAFSEDVLGARHTSEPIDVEEGETLFIHVIDHEARKAQPLESVRSEIVRTLAEIEAGKAVEADIQKLLSDAKAGKALKSLAINGVIEHAALTDRPRQSELEPLILETAFSLPWPAYTEPGNQFATRVLDNGDGLLLQLTGVKPDLAQMEMLKGKFPEEMAAVLGESELQALWTAIQGSIPVKRYLERAANEDASDEATEVDVE